MPERVSTKDTSGVAAAYGDHLCFMRTTKARLVVSKYVKNASSDLIDDNNDASAIINPEYEYIQCHVTPTSETRISYQTLPRLTAQTVIYPT